MKIIATKEKNWSRVLVSESVLVCGVMQRTWELAAVGGVVARVQTPDSGSAEVKDQQQLCC